MNQYQFKTEPIQQQQPLAFAPQPQHPNQHQAQQQHHHQEQQQHQQQPQQHQQQDDEFDKVMQQLFIDTEETAKLVELNRDVKETFLLHAQDSNRAMTLMNHFQRSQQLASAEQHRIHLTDMQNKLGQTAKNLKEIRNKLIDAHWSILNRLVGLQNKILNEYLPRWHHEQQLINNGGKTETISLDTIQRRVESAFQINWNLRNQINGLQITLAVKPYITFNYENLDKLVICTHRALENLILNAFVVEKQPPQVMKTNTRFSATVRFLCGNKLSGQHIYPTVKALILSESNARAVISYHKGLIQNSWDSLERCASHVGQQQQQQQPPPPPPQPQSEQTHHEVPVTQLNNTHSAHQQAGVILSPAESLSPTPQPTSTVHQQQHQRCPPHHLGYPSNAGPDNGFNNHMMMDTGYSDQPMSMGDQSDPSPTHQQFFQQHHPPQQQQQQQQHQQHMSTVTNMTAQHQHQQQHFGSPIEIGYNPDVPIHSKEFECSGEILNNTNILEYQEATGHMISHFRNMQLKKIKRTEKKGTESVMDEKFILLFFTQFSYTDNSKSEPPRIRRGDLMFNILAYSLPVVVIVHGNQEPHAWATVTWHNAFATRDELMYKVPDKVTWRQLGEVLSGKFRSNAGRGLTEQNLKYLASKVYRNRAENDDVLISWNQFSKEPLSDKSFTFWEWFHSILKLTKEYLRDLWKADRIYGFVGKKGCVDLLLGSAYTDPAPVGTFLLRYSETELGGITIAWVSNASLAALNPSLNDRVQISRRLSPTNTSSNVVSHLQPFVGKDLNTRSLADRIRDLNDLIYLYPSIPKNEAFEPFYTPMNNTHHVSATGYVRPMLVQTLAVNYPGTVSSGNLNEASLTPNSISQSSPEAYYQDQGLSMNEMDSTYQFDQMHEYNYTIQ